MKKLYLIIGLLLIASLCFAGRIQQHHMMIIGQEQGAGGDSDDWQIAADNDDAYTDPGDGVDCDTNIRLSEASIDIKARAEGCSASWNYTPAGFKFNSIAIPQGSTIDVAYMELYCVDASENDMNVDIYCNDDDTERTQDFNTNNSIYYRTRTSASVAWIETITNGSFNQSPSLVDIVQEIVSDASWSSGENLIFLFIPNTDNSNKCYVHEYGEGAANSAKLHIEWTE